MKKLLLLSVAALTMLACSEKNTPDAGHGEINGLKWNFKNGILTISGTGDMELDSITMSWPWYEYKEKISQVIIEEGVTSIGNSAFYGCTGLTSVTIPNSVTSIGDYAFEDCTGLTSIEIPNSVTSIGQSAFSGCSNLTSVTIPNSVKSIGDYAFYGCSSLPIIDNIRYADTYLVEVVDKLKSTYTIKERTKWIGDYAFFKCTGLTSIEIPYNVISIGTHAFCGCVGLTSVTIPNSVKSIGDYAFFKCTGLTSPVYNDHIFAFMPTSYTGAYSISNDIEYIAGEAFFECKDITSVEIPNSVSNIGEFNFYGCIGLTSVTCRAITPPLLDMFQFEGVDCSKIPLYVPQQSVEAYKSASHWKDFNPIVGI